MYESGELTAGQLKKAASQLAGMTLRDYFAAKAMQAIVSHPNTGGMTYKDISDRAWVQADAMLKARSA
jgi:hypothetical protein